MKKKKEQVVIWVITIWLLLSIIICPTLIVLHNKETKKVEMQSQQINTLMNDIKELNKSLGETFISNKNLTEENIKLKQDLEKKSNVKKPIVGARGNVLPRDREILSNNRVESKFYISSDLVLLSKVIYAECEYGNIEDALLVGNVVLNRVANGTMGNTIKSVIYRKGQYPSIYSTKFKSEPPEWAINCAKRLLNGERFCPSNVIWQSQSRQGDGLWKKVGVHYYCYSK